MLAELVPLAFSKIMQTKNYTVVIVGNEEKKFAIYVEPHVGKVLQMYLMEEERKRPLTHDLVNTTLAGFGIHLKQVVITDLQDTIYHAKLFYEQQVGSITHMVEVDARPSDALTLALINGVPIYATQEVITQSVPAED